VEYPLLPWSYVAAPPAEVRIKAAKVLANGGRPMVWSLPCSPDGDERGLAGVAAAFGPAKRFPEYFNHTEHVPFLAVLYSSQTMEAYCRGERERFEESQKEFSGALALARHNHIPTDVVLDGQVERGRLSRYRVLVLPNSAALSEEQCAEIAAFVESGGGLVATFESSLYDRSGARRKDFGLGQVLGVHQDKELLRQDEHWSTGYSVVGGAHPTIGTMEPGLRLPAGGRHLGVRESAGATRLSTLLTRCRYYCDHPGRATEYPGVVAHQFGRGRVFYLPGQFGLTYALRGFPDYRRLFLNAVKWMTDRALPVDTSLPDSVDVTLTRNSSGARVLHLVNCTADPSRPIERVGPIIGAEIGVRLGDSRPHRARALEAATDLRCEVRDGAAHIVLPILNEHEVIVIEPAP
jgi:hypothetical protein